MNKETGLEDTRREMHEISIDELELVAGGGDSWWARLVKAYERGVTRILGPGDGKPFPVMEK